jgi:diguanylate cyclase (GGDEF)-like protein
MGMIGCRVSLEERTEFLEQYLGIPVVTLYTRIEGYQSIVFDNYAAFKEGIHHLIEYHGTRKIGFVSGPKTNVDAMERLDAYKQVLAETGLSYNEDYVIYGNFEENTDGMVEEFLLSHPELDAMVFANDSMAVGGYKAFKKLNMTIGDDIKVVSFDNATFAASMIPPLTTVEANAAELAYRAVINAEIFLKTGKINDFRADTRLIKRASCGCLSSNYDNITDRLDLHTALQDKDALQLTELIYTYLFGAYAEGNQLLHIRAAINSFVNSLCEAMQHNNISEYMGGMSSEFMNIISQPIFQYTSAELFSDVLTALQFELKRLVDDIPQQNAIVELFSIFFRELAIKNYQVILRQKEGIERTSHLINNMTIDMLNIDDGGHITYERALKELSSIGMNSAYLFTYQYPVYHTRDTVFEKPRKILFRAYYDGTTAFSVPEEKQLIDTDDIFNTYPVPDDHRVTMVISPLFSNEELYGILINETQFEYFGNITPLAKQISIALKSLSLLEQQYRVQQQLNASIAQISENNIMLSEISKTDQLTGLYNRRGFLECVQNVINSTKNYNKELLVLYADMDHLKMINDQYGHEEGDFALREIAAILREAFRNTDVVSRFGGDEFVAFALTGIPDYGETMKQRIDDISKQHNSEVSKPYVIEMSVGTCEVLCNPAIDIQHVLEEADKQLYIEKRMKKRARGQLLNEDLRDVRLTS